MNSKQYGGNIFRQVRNDGSLGEKVVFEKGPDGKVQHYIRHSNYYTRVKE